MTESMGYGLAFLTGLLMGAHCIGMCGGFVMTYVSRSRNAPWRAHGGYAAGKLVSYAAIGALCGLAGASLSFTPTVRAAVAISAGLLLVAYGLNTLGVVRLPRRWELRVSQVAARAGARWRLRSPLALGLLGGFMVACGPLGAMYVLAAGTGSALEGGLLLASFGAGTLPSLVGLGVTATLVSRRLATRVLRYAGLVVIVMGMLLVNRGIAAAKQGDTCHDPTASCHPAPNTR